MPSGTITPTTEQLRARYFGTSTRTELIKNLPLSSEFPPDSQELTPSAKYIVKEVRKRLSETAITGSRERPSEEDLTRLVSFVEESEGEYLSERERTTALAALNSSLEDYDLLTPLINNPAVNDIIVSSYKDISIQCNRQNVQTDVRFPDSDSYKSFVENLLKRAGKSCTVATPVVDASIDPHIRVCVTHESFSPPGAGPMLTLRVARHRQISLEALVQYQLAPRVIIQYLASLVKSGSSTILVAGEVGSGKTTLVKALAASIDPADAILIIEDTHELALARPFVRTLLTREANTEGAGRISPAQAIRTGMRMAMNRIILGEMRDAEAAEAFIDVCSSGHAGISTIHARSARDAIARLELFLARAQGNVTIETIRRQIANAVSVVVYLDVDKTSHHRRIFEVLEVGNSSDGAVQVAPLFQYRPRESLPEWRRESGISQFSDTLHHAGVVLPLNGDSFSFEPELLYRGHHQDS